MMKPASGRLDGRGSVNRAEESPHSKEHDAGETPGRSNLPDRATENKPPLVGDGEKVV